MLHNPILMLKLGRKINVCFVAIVITIASCQNTSKQKPIANSNAFDCLIGNWVNDKDTSTLFFENWSKNEQGNYNGISFIIAHNDTVFFESIQLTEADSGTFYSVSVRNQNHAEAVHFKLTNTENHTFKFENKHHDFPQSINYQYIAPDTLKAWIEGTVNGKARKEVFLMWRKH